MTVSEANPQNITFQAGENGSTSNRNATSASQIPTAIRAVSVPISSRRIARRNSQIELPAAARLHSMESPQAESADKATATLSLIHI